MVVGVTRVLNEADIIESSVRRMLMQVDRVIVGESGSTDGTREILEQLADEYDGRLTIVDDTEPSWRQREVMTGFAMRALEEGAQWVLPYDTDEVWMADRGEIRHRLAQLPQEVLLAPARLVTHCATVLDDPADPDPLSRMGWRDAQVLPLPKVACRARRDLRIDHGNHGAWYERQKFAPAVMGVLSVHHFPYRTPDQFITRVRDAWPQLRDSGLPETHGAHIWAYGRVLDERGEDGLREFFQEHMLFTDPANQGRVYDPLPRIALPVTAAV